MTDVKQDASTEGERAKCEAGEVLVTRVGLMFPEMLTYEGWERAGNRLARVVNSSAWCLGDWLVYGADRYPKRYLHAIEKVGLEYQTLRNYAWVARRFRSDRRREALSFQHHTEVASLPEPEQEKWLDRAELGKWSRNELRRHLTAHRREIDSTGEDKAVFPRIRVAGYRVKYWKKAAQQQGTDFAKWVAAALDIAAGKVLP